MSNSTEPPEVQVHNHIKWGRGQCLRGPDGDVRALPRIIVRKPTIGDIHPIGLKWIRSYLLDVPLPYLNNLTAVECRPRSGAVGKPFGAYLVSERRIILYSVPAEEWRFSKKFEASIPAYRSHGAQVNVDDKGFRVTWPNPAKLEILFVETLFHELGHHYNFTYRRRRKVPSEKIAQESIADAHITKIWKHIKTQYEQQMPNKNTDDGGGHS